MSEMPSVPDTTGSASANSAPVREVCGLFHDHGRLEDAISRLEGSRFGRAGISVVRQRGGGSDGNAPELPGAVVTENDAQQVRTLGSGLAGAVAGMAAAGAVVLSGGAALPAVAAAAAASGGAVAGVQALGQALAPGGQGEMGRAADAEGVTLAVRVDRPGEAGRAEEIIRGAGAARVWSRERPYY